MPNTRCLFAEMERWNAFLLGNDCILCSCSGPFWLPIADGVVVHRWLCYSVSEALLTLSSALLSAEYPPRLLELCAARLPNYIGRPATVDVSSSSLSIHSMFWCRNENYGKLLGKCSSFKIRLRFVIISPSWMFTCGSGDRNLGGKTKGNHCRELIFTAWSKIWNSPKRTPPLRFRSFFQWFYYYSWWRFGIFDCRNKIKIIPAAFLLSFGNKRVLEAYNGTDVKEGA